jgi:hypothetical protein
MLRWKGVGEKGRDNDVAVGKSILEKLKDL